MTQTDQQNVPKLRFPGFEGDWKETRLQSIATVARGKFSARPRNDPRYFGGDIPFVQTGDVVNASRYIKTHSQTLNDKGLAVSKVFPQNTIMITIAANIGDTAITTYPVACPDSVVGINVSAGISTDFLFESLSLKKTELAGYATQNAQANINLQVLNPLKINLPTLPEQRKIAGFLGAVDTKIAQLAEKKRLLEDYKKGCMQQLFSQKIRFKDDSGNDFPDWEEKPLQQLADRVKEKNTAKTVVDVLTNSAVQGIISQGDYFDHDVASAENLDRYTIVQVGDFVYNPRISVTAPVGPIKRNMLRQGVMSPLYDVFRFNTGENLDFWDQNFSASSWHKYMKQVANYGARHDRMAISSGDFFNMPLPYPHPDEQRKIADFLSALDRKIDLVGAELTHARAFKQGLLQQMFV